MNERRPGFAPKIRSGETVPIVPEGMELTRVDGKLYPVPAKGNEPYSGNLAYTDRQINAIISISQTNRISEMKNVLPRRLWEL